MVKVSELARKKEPVDRAIGTMPAPGKAESEGAPATIDIRDRFGCRNPRQYDGRGNAVVCIRQEQARRALKYKLPDVE